MIYPFRIYEGRETFYISMTYAVEVTSKTRCQGWGVVDSNIIYSLGDRFMSTRFHSNEIECQTQEYYFIDFFCDKVKVIKANKLLKSSLDIREKSILKGTIPLVIVDNNKDDMIIGLGRVDFLKRRVELEMLETLPLKILGFFC